MPCGLVHVFEEFYLQLQGQSVGQASSKVSESLCLLRPSLTMKEEVVDSFKIFVNFHQNARCHNPEGSTSIIIAVGISNFTVLCR
jgi:hypothetical protein